MIDKVKEMLTRHEGRKYKPYRCPAGHLTIGVGHNIDAKGLPASIRAYLTANGRITDVMIDSLLTSDIAEAHADCIRLYPQFSTFSANRQAALIDFMFNVGPGRAATFKNMTRAINTFDWQQAAEELRNSLYWKELGGDPTGTDDGKLERPEEQYKLIREG